MVLRLGSIFRKGVLLMLNFEKIYCNSKNILTYSPIKIAANYYTPNYKAID